jgi:hypothetical protein
MINEQTSPSPTWEASRIGVIATASRSCLGYQLFNACKAVLKIAALGQLLAK